MDINIIEPTSTLPAERAYTLSMVIKSFKGRRDVEVHLFRPQWDQQEESDPDWKTIVNGCCNPSDPHISGSMRVVLESFTAEERDNIVKYLKEQYSTRLTAICSSPLTFPVPAGLAGLTQIEAGKNIGFIDFVNIPSYPLDIPLRGLYDLSQHPPIVEED